MAETKRIFIGELFEGITKSDLIQRFSRFGKIIDVDIRVKNDDTGLYCYHYHLLCKYAFIIKKKNCNR